MISYIITPKPYKNILNIRLSFVATNKIHELKLPTWIPGSYMIREFSKNIINVEFAAPATGATVEQIDKNTWQICGVKPRQKLTLIYDVYAYDFGIRTAYLDENRAYFNSTSICLYLVGGENLPHQVQIAELPSTWQIATSLYNPSSNTYIADSYWRLIDCPFEMGVLSVLEFKVCGVQHKIVLSGIISANFDAKQLINDVKKICQTQVRLFNAKGKAPFTQYIFLLHLGGEIYTGLEHCDSTALLAPYFSLPSHHATNRSDDYVKLLGLISHEYFHAWNVKRIKPQQFNPYNLDTENYTTLLWWFEGVTSYYDDLMLYRSGIIDDKKYLSLMLNNVNSVYKYAGVDKQSLANSSLTSWIKYYRQDANSPNALVSYYIKGALLGAFLDITIRNKTKGKNSLDDVLRGLYNKWCSDGLGVQDENFIKLIQNFVACDITKEINQFVYTTKPLPLKKLFASVGLELIELINRAFSEVGLVVENNQQIPTPKFELGAKLSQQAIGFKVITVYNNSLASKLGLCPDDLLIAINGIKLTDINRQLAELSLSAPLEIAYFRREVLHSVTKTLPDSQSCKVYYMRVVNSSKLNTWLS
jgi:predicted metalloprotease with PDZ domain